jgi:DNA polymerase-3 subunit delta
MQIRADQLAQALLRGLRGLYVLHGDEPLLAQEAADALRAAARNAGCTERVVHTVQGAHFDWSGLLGETSALSLFADRRLVEIRIPSGKPGKDGSEGLQRLVETLSDDNIVLITLPRLDRTQLGSAWFTALEGAGVTVRIDPVERAHCLNGSPSAWRPRACGWKRGGRTAHPGLFCRPHRRQPAGRPPGDAANSPCCTPAVR